MQLQFWKMQGLGNDFIVFYAKPAEFKPDPILIRKLSDRHFGVGCDQVLWVMPTTSAKADIGLRIFNNDGSESLQCGNGLRCVARFARDAGLVPKKEINIATQNQIYQAILDHDDQVTVNMQAPIFTPRDIPFNVQQQANSYNLTTPLGIFAMGVVSMGNPHAVLQVDNIDRAEVERVGAVLSQHEQFPQQTNVEFMQILNPNHIRLRVYERGAAETLACGSGACAAVVIGRLKKLLAEKVRVSLPGGDLTVVWQGGQTPVWLTGPAVKVFEGCLG